jgi:hypothetical protein
MSGHSLLMNLASFVPVIFGMVWATVALIVASFDITITARALCGARHRHGFDTAITFSREINSSTGARGRPRDVFFRKRAVSKNSG